MQQNKKNYLWTQSGARLHFIKTQKGSSCNWLFLPGGPGLGSESLMELVEGLELTGTVWLLDLPGDGSNIKKNNRDAFEKWPQAIFEAVTALENVILVGHSTGGMFALSQPLLESHLKGLVLMDSAPDSSWQANLAEMFQATPIPGFEEVNQNFLQNPNNQTLKALTIKSAPYFFTNSGFEQGSKLLASLPYNYDTFDWSDKNFDSTYQAKWIPQTLPVLILSGSKDTLTPLSLFQKNRDFQRPNITFVEISHAGHFPWIENPEEIQVAFDKFIKKL